MRVHLFIGHLSLTSCVCVHQIREELCANGINVYPQKEFDEDAEDRMINEKIRVRRSRVPITSEDHLLI